MKLRKRKKSQTGKTIIFLLLAITFTCSTFFLAHKMMGKIRELSQIKNEFSILQETQADLQKEVKDIKLKEQQAQGDVQKLEQQLKQKLATIKKANSNQTINSQSDSKKYAYLTFDDGPSKNTPKILDFLKANHIKATFFVVGDPNRMEIYKRIVDEGHTLGVHSNTHIYREIYKSIDNFTKDIDELSHLLEKATGVKPSVLRFPGGSNNSLSKKYSGYDIMAEIIPKVKKEGYAYFDWNVDSGDAQKANQDAKIIANTVLNQARDKDYAIILMHDAAAKATTADALPAIVEGLRKQGFTFEGLTKESQPIHFR